MKQMVRRTIALALCVVMFIGMMPMIAVEVSAKEGFGPVVIQGGLRDFKWPVPNYYGLSSCFYDNRIAAGEAKEHYAIDIPTGGTKANIVAAYDGEVCEITKNGVNDGGYGNAVMIRHTYFTSSGSTITLYSRYAHMDSISVTNGTKVVGGKTVLGKVGGSGYGLSDKYSLHLDFQILTSSKWREREKYSIDPFANNLLELPSGIYKGGTTECCQRYIDLIKKEYANPIYPVYTAYFDECSRVYPSYGTITINNSCNPYTLPCNSDTAKKYGCISTALTAKALKPGDKVEVIGIVMNSEDNYWYKVVLSDGSTAWVYSKQAGVMTHKDPYISGSILPDTISGAVALSGSVVTGGCQLNSVWGVVYNSSAKEVLTSSKASTSTTSSFTLGGSVVDKTLTFESLKSYGNATYKLYIFGNATSYSLDSNYKLQTYTRNFEAGNKIFNFKISSGSGETTCSHAYNSKVTQAATCAAAGIRTYTCSKCGASYTETIPATGNHSYGNWVIIQSSTCTTEGIEQNKCTACGGTQTQTIPANGHSYGGWATQKEATCTSEGIKTNTCYACGDVQQMDIPKTGHTYESRVIGATCIDYAKTQHTCVNCGHSYEEYKKENVSGWSVTKPAGVPDSLIESRTEYRYRTQEVTTGSSDVMSGWTLYNTTTQWGDYGAWSSWSQTPASQSDSTNVETRTAYAYYYYKCPGCGAHMHGWGITCPTWAGGCGKTKINSGDYVQVWSPISHSSAGLKDFHGTGKYYTTIDGQRVFKHDASPITQYRYRTRNIEYIYHFYRWTDWSGWSATYVPANDTTMVETRTVYRSINSSLGDHQWTNATCTAPKTCSLCHTTEGSALDHKEVTDKAVAATCTADGKTEGKHCSVCGTVTVAQQTVKAMGHSFADGKCSTCGAADPDYVAPTEPKPTEPEVTEPKPTEPEVQGVTRIAGGDRYQTSFKSADQLKAVLGVEKFQNIVVASGTDFPDALAGSYLAAQKDAPILLVRAKNVNDVKDYIKKNLVPGGTVYLLGGVNAVPKTMETGLDGFKVKRLGGANRYETNLLILKEAGVGDKDIIVCTGLNFADSLSASAVGLPILLVKDGLYASQKEFLKNNGGDFIIVGGSNAVNATVEKQLKGYGTVKRLAGNTRYDTSVLVAKEFFNAPTSAVLAYAQNFPDGLCGGPVAYNLNAPLILTDNNKPKAAVTYTTGLAIKSGYVLGGTGLISDKVVKNIFSMSASDAIKVK